MAFVSKRKRKEEKQSERDVIRQFKAIFDNLTMKHDEDKEDEVNEDEKESDVLWDYVLLHRNVFKKAYNKMKFNMSKQQFDALVNDDENENEDDEKKSRETRARELYSIMIDEKDFDDSYGLRSDTIAIFISHPWTAFEVEDTYYMDMMQVFDETVQFDHKTEKRFQQWYKKYK